MMPDVQTELENMQPFQLFTELDWATAFHQIPLDDESSQRLAISTQWGLYRPRFVPEGITCGSALLMTHAQRIFSDFRPWALALHDNLLIGATDLNDMAIKISKVLHRCQENHIQLKMSKSKVAYTSIPFFGYILNQGSYTSDPQRLSDINAVKFPKSLTQVQSFLGMLNYISPFIPMFAERIAPIHAMNSKSFSYDKATWKGIDYCEAFEQAKSAVLHATTIYLPDRSLPWGLKCDAAKYGFGSILTQAMPIDRLTEAELLQAKALNLIYIFPINGIPTEVVDAPIALMSRKFSDAATRWPVTQQEQYAIVAAYQKWERLLILKPHCLHTDHKNLVDLLPENAGTNPKIARWRQWLANFPFFIRHIPGKLNIVADYLSRVHAPLLINTGLASLTSLTPTEMLENVHARTPGGHVGAMSTWRAVHAQYPDSKISLSTAKAYVEACTICQKARNIKQPMETRNKTIPLDNARSSTHVDTLSLEKDANGNEYAFVFINAFTKHTMMFPATDKSAKSFCNALIRYMATMGITDIFIADNGTEFTNEAAEIVANALGTMFTFTIAHRPQANSIVERVNQTILQELRIIMTSPEFWNRWSDPYVIAIVTLSINMRTHTTTGYSPIALTYGRTAMHYFRQPLDVHLPQHTDLDEADQDLKNLQEMARRNMVQAEQKRLKIQPTAYVTYHTGDLVLRDPITQTGAIRLRTRKLEPHYMGPYMVMEQKHESNCVICSELHDDSKIHKFHHSTLRIFDGTTEQAKQLALIDKQEHAISAIIDHTGSTARRSTLTFKVQFTDGSTDALPWNVIQHTEALQAYLAPFIFGRVLLMTQKQATDFAAEHNPRNDEKTIQAILRLPEEDRPYVGQTRYLTVHFFHHEEWTTCQQPSILQNKNRRNREYVFHIKISQISSKRIEIHIPDLDITTGRRQIKYRKDLTLATLLMYSIPKADMTEAQIEITEAQLQQGTLRSLLHTAANLNLLDPAHSQQFLTSTQAIPQVYLRMKYHRDH
jgi:hypothetical protein